VRVGLNVLYLVPGEVGGSEIYARELIGALGNARPDDEFLVYCAREAADSLGAEAWPANVTVHVVGVNARNKPARLAAELLKLPRIARRDRIELMHSLGQTTPWWGCGTRVLTILDLIYHHYPATFPRAARLGLEFVIPIGARRAKRITTISQATATDLEKTYAVDPSKIDVVHLGAGFAEPGVAATREQLATDFGLWPGDYSLCVSSGHEHKNIPRLLHAFTKLPSERRLVLVGHAGLDQEQLIAQARELGLAERVLFTGWIGSEELEGFYREATAFIYPTLMEGFGLPVLEAMHRGVPVACSNTSSLPEVAGEAALTFDPTDDDAIVAAIERLMTDAQLREELRERGVAQAANFTWERCAEETLAFYRRALAPADATQAVE
jgi:glycosyltransferase involved in cell wall biosynthesis